VDASDAVKVRAFAAADQEAARRLIVEGLGAHFGFVDESMNPDLNDIATSYAKHVFLVADAGGEIVATGALKLEGDGRGQIVRMSTAPDWRRRGIASAVLRGLLEAARERSCASVFLATNAAWRDARGLYEANGFVLVAEGDGGCLFPLELS
jgi:GNAT superfamily N-acetyltransferase